MRTVYRLCSALLATVLLLGSFCSCSLLPTRNNNNDNSNSGNVAGSVNELDQISSKTAPAPVIPDYSGRNTMNVAVKTEIGTVSPFFAQTEAELSAASLAFARLVNTDRGGVPITQGKNGQTVDYMGTEYSYYGIADVHVEKNADGTADYSFSLREDAFFSDGTNITADDVIFSMYVLLDPSYRGYSSFGSLPIAGLNEYRSGMVSLADRIYYTEGEEVDSVASSDVRRFRDTLKTVQKSYVDGILGYIREEYSAADLRKFAGKWTDKVEADEYLCAISMVLLGYAEWQTDAEGEYTGVLITDDGAEFGCIEIFPEYSDFFTCAANSADSLLSLDEVFPEGDLESALRDAFGAEYSAFFEVMRSFGKKTESVSGITKTGMYSLTVRIERYDPSDIYGFTFFVAPLHAYGSRDAYKYTESRFGFDKGNVSAISQATTRVSSGAYCYKGEKEGAYLFERNQMYYLGCPKVRYIELRRLTDGEDSVGAISEGKYDVISRELDGQIMAQLESVNLDGEKVIAQSYGNGGYGYIGIMCDSVKISDDTSATASTSLRRALCVLLSLYSDAACDTFLPKGYTSADSPAIIGTYALPSAKAAYSLNMRGEQIYTDGMTLKQKKAAAAKTALEYFMDAGYTVNNAGTRITSAPEGGSLTFEFIMLRGEPYSAYLTEVIKNTSDALAELGITLKVEYADGVRDLENRLTEGKVQLWAYDRDLSPEPRLPLYYHTKHIPSSSGEQGENYSRISDKVLDELLLKADSAENKQSRVQLLSDAMRCVYASGAEIPLYHTNSVTLMSASLYKENIELKNTTYYYQWYDTAHIVELS